jgi:hypothetical protein
MCRYDRRGLCNGELFNMYSNSWLERQNLRERGLDMQHAWKHETFYPEYVKVEGHVRNKDVDERIQILVFKK